MQSGIDNTKNVPARNEAEGVYVQDLAEGAVVEVETQHHHYRLQKRAGSTVQLTGHPTFCPQPTAVQIEGSFGERPMTDPRPGFIAPGRYMVFKHPVFNSVTTSRIREMHREH